jgi:hypothetical protein
MNCEMQYYNLQGLCRAIDIYNDVEQYTGEHKAIGYRYILKYGYKEPRIAPSKEQIINKLIFSIENSNMNTSDENSKIMNFVDILLEFSPVDGERLLEKIRTNQLVIDPSRAPRQNGPKNTIYSDSQSTHNQSIKSSVVSAAIKLVHKYPFVPNDPRKRRMEIDQLFENLGEKLCNYLPNDEIARQTIKTTLNRLRIDNASFQGIMCCDVVISLEKWIEKECKDNSRELYTRLCEELVEMNLYCSTGLITRLINVMQGFTDDPDYMIKISASDQCKSVVYNYLDNSLKNCKDEGVMDGMLESVDSQERRKYVLFIKKSINTKLRDWEAEYGKEFYDLIKPSVNEYTKEKIY